MNSNDKHFILLFFTVIDPVLIEILAMGCVILAELMKEDIFNFS